jgi:hypothetical protein
MRTVQKSGCTRVVVDAPVEEVWAVVADVPRVGEWSHECRSARWLDGAAEAAPGVRFRGRNRAGWARWSRTCEIVAVDRPRELVWRTVPSVRYPDSSEWRIRLAPAGQGTAITQSFAALRVPWLLDRLYARLIPAHTDRDNALAGDLRRLGDAARNGVRT